MSLKMAFPVTESVVTKQHPFGCCFCINRHDWRWHMNPRQRQMIKEAYQAGYLEALDENIFSGAAKVATKFGKFLRKLFRGGGDVVDDVTPTTPAEVLNKIDDLSKQLDQVDDPPPFPSIDDLRSRPRPSYTRPPEEIPPDLDDVADEYGVDQFGNIDPDAQPDLRKALGNQGLDNLLRDALKQERLQEYADDLGIDINDIPPDIVDDITRGIDDIDPDDLIDLFGGGG